MNEVELLGFPDSYPIEKQEIGDFVDSILQKLGISNWLMGLLFTDDKGIRQFNREWRSIDAPTDVLSFAQIDGDAVPTMDAASFEAGDIVISLQQVYRQAEMQKRSPEEELRRVIIHGILHLNGMDHPDDDYECTMLKLQEKLLCETRKLVVGI